MEDDRNGRSSKWRSSCLLGNLRSDAKNKRMQVMLENSATYSASPSAKTPMLSFPFFHILLYLFRRDWTWISSWPSSICGISVRVCERLLTSGGNWGCGVSSWTRGWKLFRAKGWLCFPLADGHFPYTRGWFQNRNGSKSMKHHGPWIYGWTSITPSDLRRTKNFFPGVFVAVLTHAGPHCCCEAIYARASEVFSKMFFETSFREQQETTPRVVVTWRHFIGRTGQRQTHENLMVYTTLLDCRMLLL